MRIDPRFYKKWHQRVHDFRLLKVDILNIECNFCLIIPSPQKMDEVPSQVDSD